GFPRKMARTEMEWDGDTLRARTIRNDAVIMSATCTFTDSGEWIDSGPAVNVKIMPSVTGEGNDIDVITIADLEYRIKSGRSGDVQVTIQGCPDDDMSMIHVESTMIGLYFDTDILVPPGRVIGRTLG
ncbi:MAG: acetoacetate decarboxylase family protein, partial [Candidatus Thorarchaeota archaeon]